MQFVDALEETSKGRNGMTNFERVREFMKAMEQERPSTATWPDQKTEDLRKALILEEYKELEEAIADRDMVAVADALADLLYVVYGAGVTFGLPLDEIFREVHRSNMTKLDENGQPIKNEAGKVVKGPRYQAPQLERFIEMTKETL
jgi:predicted HAD superfamily Cof-like phosphohydrolase